MSFPIVQWVFSSLFFIYFYEEKNVNIILSLLLSVENFQTHRPPTTTARCWTTDDHHHNKSDNNNTISTIWKCVTVLQHQWLCSTQMLKNGKCLL